MRKITKYFGIGLMGLALSTVASCSDDDDNCNSENSSSIVYNNHVFDKAYTLQEGQDFFGTVAHNITGTDAIDTTQIMSFAEACRYFNNNYLDYKSSTGESPFDSLVANMTKILTGDLSGITSSMDRYKRFAGEYTANTTNKQWDKVGNKNYRIVLNFKDTAGVDMTASLAWVPANPTLPENFEGDMVSIKPNVITVTGVNGYVLSDTLPSVVQLSIKGGKDNIDLGGVISLSVVDGKIIDAVMKLRLGMMGIKMEMSILNTLTNSTLTGFNKGKILFQISSKTVGTNLINSMVDYKKYPPTQSMTSKRITLDNNLQIAYTQNRITLLNKIKEMRAAGLKPKSKAYAEGLVEAKKQAQNTMMCNVTDNIYLGSVSPRAVEVKTGVWSSVPFITLHDGSSYSIIEFDKKGFILNMSSKLQTLIGRLGELTGIDSSTM